LKRRNVDVVEEYQFGGEWISMWWRKYQPR